MKYYSPLRYPGGKAKLYSFARSIIMQNNLEDCHYVEPFAGGAGLALRLLFNELVAKITINDFDRSIYAFWKIVLSRNDELCDWVKSVDVCVDEWVRQKEVQTRKEEVSEFELAVSTFFLNRTNVSGVLKGGIIGGCKQTGKYRIDVRFNKPDLISRLRKIERFRNRITVTNYDGKELMKLLESNDEKLFVYLDPPYYQKGSELYMNFLKDTDHIELAEVIKALRHRWIVSYDDHVFIHNLYEHMPRIRYSLSQNTSNRVGQEIVVFSDRIKFDSSITYLKAASQF